MYRYEAKLDNLSRILSVVVICILIIPVSTMIVKAQQGNPEIYIIIALLLLAFLFVWCYRPLYYSIDAESIKVHRAIGAYRIVLADVIEISRTSKQELGWGIRLFGSGGLFGYFGLFRYRNLGKTTVYVSDLSKMILIRTADDKKVLISPDDAEDFLLRVKGMMK